jgi:hypothetical protein
LFSSGVRSITTATARLVWDIFPAILTVEADGEL